MVWREHYSSIGAAMTVRGWQKMNKMRSLSYPNKTSLWQNPYISTLLRSPIRNAINYIQILYKKARISLFSCHHNHIRIQRAQRSAECTALSEQAQIFYIVYR